MEYSFTPQLEREYLWVRSMQEARAKMGLPPLSPSKLRRLANEVREIKGSEFGLDSYDPVVQQLLIQDEQIDPSINVAQIFNRDNLLKDWGVAIKEFRKTASSIEDGNGNTVDLTTIPITAINQDYGQYLNDGNSKHTVFYVNRSDYAKYLDALNNGGNVDRILPRAVVNLDNEFIRPTRSLSREGKTKVARPDMPVEEVYTVYGWNGRKLDDDTREPGLKDLMDTLVSKEDKLVLSRVFANTEIRSDRAQYIVNMFNELRKNGYAVSVEEPLSYLGDVTQLNVRVDNNMVLRLYDESNPEYVGRVQTPTRMYYWQAEVKGKAILEELNSTFAPSVQDSMRLLNAVTGKDVSRLSQHRYSRSNRDSDAEFNKNTNGASYSNYRFIDVTLDHPTETEVVDGVTRPVRYNVYSAPRGNSAKSVAFESKSAATDFLKKQIELATIAYTDSIKFDELLEASSVVEKAREILDNRAYTNDQKKEARALLEEANVHVEHLYDNRYSSSQSDLFEDMVQIRHYMAHPEVYNATRKLELKSIPDEEVKSELEDFIRASADGLTDPDQALTELHKAFIDTHLGDFDNGFNPAIVAELGADENRPRLSYAVEAAIKRSGYDQSKLIGNEMAVDRLRDRMIEFDQDSARSLADVLASDPEHKEYQTKAMLRVQEHLTVDNISNVDIQIDENGVIQYSYDRPNIFGKDGSTQRMTNQIGQVFNEDEYGIIQTKFAGSESFGFVPGYEAYFVPGETYKIAEGLESDDERRSRLRLRSYEQAIMAEIDRNMVEQMQGAYMGGRGDDRYDNFIDTMGASSLNKVYRSQLQGFKLDPDYVDRFLELRSEDELKTNIRTLRNRVRFPNRYGDISGTNFDDYVKQDGFNEAKLVGENLRVVDPKWNNIFDPYMLGSGKNQGVERYLVDGAVVNADGTVQASEGWENPFTGELERDRVAMTKQESFKYIDSMPSDRQMMATKQALVALQVTEPVGVAFMNFGGWTYDDGMVISKEYAEKYQVPVYEDENGAMRAQRKGDKQSDFGSNKGVANLIIDRNMSEEEARAQGIWKEVQFFKANPELDVVMGPYATLSRNNMSVLKQARDSKTIDLVDPLRGEVKSNGIGFMPMMITDMTVDKKSHVYDKSDVAKGKGRSVSTLLMLNLQALDAKGIINEVYGNNVTPWADLREYALVQGVDIDHDGNLKVGYHPQEGEERLHFKVDPNKSADDFMKEIANNGGILNLPFPLINKELDKQLLRNPNEPKVKDYASRALTRDENGEFGIPVLSGALRRSTEMMDGSTAIHDVTDHYIEIYKRASSYIEVADKIKDLQANGGDKAEIAKLKDQQSKLWQNAQRYYERIQSDTAPKIDGPGANGKHSLIRDKITSKRMNNSATLVACADPRLDVNQIAISRETAEKMGLTEGSKVLGWRDPTWRTGAVRSFEITIDDSVTGFAMNPLMDKSHDGDFDGDAYGFVALRSEEALKELDTILSHEANILNYGDGQVEIDGENYYPLFVNDGMDVASSSHAFKENGKDDPEELRKKATIMANDPSVDRKEILNVLNEYVHTALRSDENFATDYIDLTDSQTVMTSLAKIVNKKAKGKASNLLECVKYEGAELSGVQFDKTNLNEPINYVSSDKHQAENVEIVTELLRDVDKGMLMDVLNVDAPAVHTFATDKDRLAVQYATATKSDNTGRPGTLMQDATATFRNKALREAMEVFYKPTQMTLQIKHNAVQAYDINTQFSNNGRISALFLTGQDPDAPRDASSNEKLMTTNQWISKVEAELDSLGLDYNKDHVNVLGKALTGSNGYVRSLEKAFNEEASYFNKLSFGGVSGGKDGGIRALVKGGVQEACLFQDENDIDRAVVPNAIKDKSVIMARPDVLVQKQNSFEEIKTRLTELEQDDQRKLTLDRDVESEVVVETPSVDIVTTTPEIDSEVEVDHGFSL
jgi:hypothetical protein